MMVSERDGRATRRPAVLVHDSWWAVRSMTIALLCLASIASFAQKEHANIIGVGHTDILDTYLSQEAATGIDLRYTWEKANRKPERHWSSYVSQEAFLTKAGTRGNDNSFLGAMYNLRFGWHYNLDSPLALGSYGAMSESLGATHASPLNVRLGLLADFSLGGLYNTRNGNNPAQARVSLSVDPSVMLAWRFSVKGKPFALRYEAAVPLVGMAFSPNYGQSYYEIFSRGNYDHNIVFTSPFSGPQLHQMLAFDFRLWGTTFTVGYLGDIRQMDANNLKFHQYTHSVVFGWRY